MRIAMRGKSMLITMALIRLSAAVLFGLIAEEIVSIKCKNGWAWGGVAAALVLLFL